MWLPGLQGVVKMSESPVLTGSLWVTEEGDDEVLALVWVLSLGAGTFGSSSLFFFLLLRVTCIHSLLLSSVVASVASVVLVLVVSLFVSLVVSVVPVILVRLLVLLFSASPSRWTESTVLCGIVWQDGQPAYNFSSAAVCPPLPPPSFVDPGNIECLGWPGSLPVQAQPEYIVAMGCPVSCAKLCHFLHPAKGTQVIGHHVFYEICLGIAYCYLYSTSSMYSGWSRKNLVLTQFSTSLAACSLVGNSTFQSYVDRNTALRRPLYTQILKWILFQPHKSPRLDVDDDEQDNTGVQGFRYLWDG